MLSLLKPLLHIRLVLVLPQLHKLVRHRRLIRLVRLIVIGIVWHFTSSFLPEIKYGLVLAVPGVINNAIMQAYYMA